MNTNLMQEFVLKPSRSLETLWCHHRKKLNFAALIRSTSGDAWMGPVWIKCCWGSPQQWSKSPDYWRYSSRLWGQEYQARCIKLGHWETCFLKPFACWNMCLNHLSWRLCLSALNNWKMKNTHISQVKQGSNTSMCLAQLICTFTFFDDISTAPRHYMIPKCHLHASLYPHGPPCWTLPWKKNKLCFQHVNVDLEPFYPQKH